MRMPGWGVALGDKLQGVRVRLQIAATRYPQRRYAELTGAGAAPR